MNVRDLADMRQLGRHHLNAALAQLDQRVDDIYEDLGLDRTPLDRRWRRLLEMRELEQRRS